MLRLENILNRQIRLAAGLQTPVPLHIPTFQEGHIAGASFQASEWWFVDRGVPVAKLEQAPPRPRMKIHKTESRVPLSLDWKSSLKDPKDEELLRKRGLIED